MLAGKRAAIVTHLKYANIQTRSLQYETQPTQRSRAPVSLGFCELDRMPLLDLGNKLIDCWLLCDLQGAPCVHPDCKPDPKGRFGERKPVLGCLVVASVGTRECPRFALCYRCEQCRARVAVNRGSMIYPQARGSKGLRERTLCFWNCVEGATMTFTARQLKISENAVREYYTMARCIMAMGALERQSKIKFGGFGTKTVDIEIDEHVFFVWEDGDIKYFYVYIGVIQRGNMQTLWMAPLIGTDPLMPPGVTHSTKEVRVPPVTDQFVLSVCDKLFDEDTNGVLMADSALAYQRLLHKGIKDKHLVDHSGTPKEFSRSVSALADVETMDTRPAIASTNLLDSEWGRRLLALLALIIPSTSSNACEGKDFNYLFGLVDCMIAILSVFDMLDELTKLEDTLDTLHTSPNIR